MQPLHGAVLPAVRMQATAHSPCKLMQRYNHHPVFLPSLLNLLLTQSVYSLTARGSVLSTSGLNLHGHASTHLNTGCRRGPFVPRRSAHGPTPPPKTMHNPTLAPPPISAQPPHLRKTRQTHAYSTAVYDATLR